jgi:hypothetical protein
VSGEAEVADSLSANFPLISLSKYFGCKGSGAFALA